MEQTKQQQKEWQEFKDDLFRSMDSEYKELRRILDPVFHNKTKYVEGKLLKDCFRHIGSIINSQHILRGDKK